MKLPPLPDPLRRLLSRLPQYPASAAFAAALTLWLGETLGTGAHPELAGKLFSLHITDAGVTLTFQVMRYGFAPSGVANPDLALTATAEDFWRSCCAARIPTRCSSAAVS